MDLYAGVSVGEPSAQPRNQDVQRITLHVVIESVDLLDEFIAEYETSRVAQERPKERQFASVEGERGPMNCNLMGDEVEGE